MSTYKPIIINNGQFLMEETEPSIGKLIGEFVDVVIPRGFVTEWTVPDSKSITLPFTNNGTYNATVDWGDGSALSTITTYSDANATHTYVSAGTYEIEIKGEAPGWSINNNAATASYITDIIHWGDRTEFSGFSYLSNGFYGCLNLKTTGKGKILSNSNLSTFIRLFCNCSSLSGITSGLFDYSTELTSSAFQSTFQYCPNITAIPNGLFNYNTGVTSDAFNSTFGGGSSITIIPTDLFKYNTIVSSNGFYRTFYGCTVLSSIPSDLFRYNILLTGSAFVYTFALCSSITTIPSGLFNHNTGVTNFTSTFQNCYALLEIPTDLFKYNTEATNFSNTFYACTNLQTVPDLLFKYNTLATNFTNVLGYAYDLALNPKTFYDTGEQSTRFAGKAMIFTNCFYRSSSYANGTAPDLWNCTLDSVTSTSCFGGSGNNATSLTNYADIPDGWK
jgi:hypothetical protein